MWFVYLDQLQNLGATALRLSILWHRDRRQRANSVVASLYPPVASREWR